MCSFVPVVRFYIGLKISFYEAIGSTPAVVGCIRMACNGGRALFFL